MDLLTILEWVLRAVLLIVSGFLVLFILMQRSKSDGVGSAFGGAVMSEAFGAQSSNILTKLTSYGIVLFFALTLTLSSIYQHRQNNSGVIDKVKQQLATEPDSALAPLTPNVGTNAAPAATEAAAKSTNAAVEASAPTKKKQN